MIIYMSCPTDHEPDISIDYDIFLEKLKILRKSNLVKNDLDRQLMELINEKYADLMYCCKMRLLTQLDSSEIYI